MSRVIPLDIPDDLYQRIEEMAARRGQSPDEFLLTIINRKLRVADNGQTGDGVPLEEYDPKADPLARFMGIITSDEPGWADRHDEYLAKAYEDTHEDE